MARKNKGKGGGNPNRPRFWGKHAVAAALGAGRFVTSLLFGLTPTDASTTGAAIALMLAVSAIAGYLPARRASRLDPMRALRHD